MLNVGNHNIVSATMLEHAMESYRELSNTWRDIERKAQGTIASSGIFIAGVSVAISRFETLNLLVSSLLIISILLLSLSAYKAIRVLEVSEMDTIEGIGNVLDKASELLRTSEISTEALSKFTIDRVQKWEVANVALYKENNIKAEKLKSSHNVLLIGIISVIVSLVTMIVTK